jgi:hypothetical protein
MQFCIKLHYQYKMGNETTQEGFFKEGEVSSKNLDIISSNERFMKSNSFGQKGLGNPEEYELLLIDNDGIRKSFEYFNKGIHYMLNGTESDRPVFQVFTFFMTER